MTKVISTAVAVILLVYAFPADAQYLDDTPNERLGARLSFAGTRGELNEHFGNAYDITLYFTEMMFNPLNLDVKIGATYLGDLKNQDLGEDIVGISGIASEMRLAYLTLGPQYAYALTPDGKQTLYASLGVGIYSVSMLHDTGIQAFNYSDQHPGINAGFGFYRRFTKNWNIEISASAHKLWTGEKKDGLYYLFTEGSKDPWVFLLGAGVALNLR